VLFPLVARAGVLAEADSVLAAARSGRGTLVTVTGEPGIGKTRLAEAVADRAGAGRTGAERAEAFEVVWTWCPAAASGAALGPWSRVVRTLAGGHAAAARLVGRARRQRHSAPPVTEQEEGRGAEQPSRPVSR